MKLLFAIMLIFGLFLAIDCLSQQGDKPIPTKQDSSRTDSTRSGILTDIKNSKVSKRLVKTISRKQATNPTATIKSEDFFRPYEGKIIRHILLRQVGFDKSVTDTTHRVRTAITRLGNKLHANTKERVIRENLFIRENKTVNPYKMADNERYLRDLDFILDAKFFIVPLETTDDSVDVIVMTRDVFSLGGSFNPSSPTKTRFRLYDNNLFGYGQRVTYTGQIEDGRDPVYGYEVSYRKTSVGGSFISATAGYTQLNTGSSYGHENEKAYYIKLDRPLVSPYTRFAGGMEISRNWSENVFSLPDSNFWQYRYLVNDAWIGYNIGANVNHGNRGRHFFALRVFDQHFTREPFQTMENPNPIYSNRRFVLGGFTFFKQDFYTARYIYGFGRTEDLPYGHTMSLYVGWARQLGLERPYVGIDFGKSIVSPNGQFYNILLRTGAFNNDGLEDAVVLVSGSLTSRLISYDRFLMRQTFGGDFTHVFNQRISLPLDIRDEFGLRGFRPDSVLGTKRVHVNTETVVFTPYHLLGFKFAPFVYGEAVWIASHNQLLLKKSPYLGLGGGVRTRNENLVFGTIELRFMYYPKTAEDISKFNVRMSSNLRVKYSGSFVRPPSFVQYN